MLNHLPSKFLFRTYHVAKHTQTCWGPSGEEIRREGIFSMELILVMMAIRTRCVKDSE